MSATTQMVLIAVLSFGCVAILAQLGLSWCRRHQTSGARRLRGRIARLSQQDGDRTNQVDARLVVSRGIVERVDAFLVRAGVAGSLQVLISQAGLTWHPARLVLTCMAWAVAVGLLCAVASVGVAGSIACAACAALVPWAHIERRKTSRLQALERQLPEVLEVIGRAMRSGYSFSGALKVVGEEMPAPIGPEFAKTQDEISFGIPVKDALQNLLMRVPSDNLRYMVVATLVQRETGGNLAEIFTKIARLMRERIALQGQIRVLSADGRVSALILCLLPIVGGVGMYFMNRPYISKLWESSDGQFLLMLSAVMMVSGILWMRSVIRIHS